MKRLTHTALTALLGLSAIGSHAQDGSEGAPAKDGWYQIHVAVFGHNSGAGEYEEVWRKQLQLKYPRQLMRLKTREQYLADLCGINDNDQTGVESGNRLVDILERVDSGAGYPEEAPQALDPACREFRPDLFPPTEAEKNRAQADATIAAAQSLVSGKSETRAPAKGRQPPIPFVLSEQVSDPEFAEMVKKIRGAARYRLLFSGSWPQALKPRGEAPAVLIQGGDQVGQHYQLEGYVKLALERYLHIDTDLWLSQFRARQLPHNSGLTAVGEQAFSDKSDRETAREFPALPVPFPVNDRRATPASTDTATQPTRHNALPEGQSDNKLNVLLADDSSHTVERTVVMQQTRRMRSEEVHYLDHPLFGVLVKITPLPGEEGGAKPRR